MLFFNLFVFSNFYKPITIRIGVKNVIVYQLYYNGCKSFSVLRDTKSNTIGVRVLAQPQTWIQRPITRNSILNFQIKSTHHTKKGFAGYNNIILFLILSYWSSVFFFQMRVELGWKLYDKLSFFLSLYYVIYLIL